MADVIVTILTPTLTGSDYFKTRYRLLPAGAYTANVNRTNAPFTLSGLAVGDYEMEVIFVDVEGATEIECPAVIHSFSVDPEFTCFPFDAEIEQNGNLYELVITYTLPSPLSWPPCGFDITWNQNGSNNTIHYATLPLSGEIRYTLPANLDVNLIVMADMCGYFNVCFEETVPKIPSPNCTPAILTGYDLNYNPLSGVWRIRLNITNSNPTTNNYVFAFQELSLTNMPPDSGFHTEIGSFSAGQALFFGNTIVQPKGIFLTAPNPNPDDPPIYIPNCIIYQLSFVDYCNVPHQITVCGMWTPPPQGSPPGTPGTFNNTINCCN